MLDDCAGQMDGALFVTPSVGTGFTVTLVFDAELVQPLAAAVTE